MSLVTKDDNKDYKVDDEQLVRLEEAVIGNRRLGFITVVLDNSILAYRERDEISGSIEIGKGAEIRSKKLIISADVPIRRSNSDLDIIPETARFKYVLSGGEEVPGQEIKPLKHKIEEDEVLVTFNIEINFI